MENLAVTVNLPNLKLNIPEKEINFHHLERIIFNLSRKIGQELLEELLQLIDDKLKKERKRGERGKGGERRRKEGREKGREKGNSRCSQKKTQTKTQDTSQSKRKRSKKRKKGDLKDES